MPRRGDQPWVLLATRLPKRIHHAVRWHCVTTETTIMEFVAAALEEKLRNEGRRAGGRRVSG